MGRRVVIVGGGLAGLSAAAALTQSSCQTTLLESRPRLGGRAGSFLDKETGEWIDTCQHVGMGCCTNLRHFAELVEIDDLFHTQSELLFVGPEGQRCRFRASSLLPAPLHLLPALLRLRYLTWRERRQLGADVWQLAHPRWGVEQGMSFAEWLTRHATTAALRERFWDVILVSALSETAERISVPYARKVFVDAFLAHRDGWSVQIPTVPLDELYGRRLTDWLTSRGAIVRTQAGVDRLEVEERRVTAVQLRSGETVEGDEFIVAVPWHQASNLLPHSLVDHKDFADMASLESAPITSVHLWFDRPVLDVPHAVLVGKLSQWVFRRIKSSQLSTLNAEQADYVQVVISASRSLAGRTPEEVIGEVVNELSSIWPVVGEAELIASRVVTAHRAVFSPLAGVDALRPNQQSPSENLQLAGDWTNTGWPATMEGAVKSGFVAAQNVLERLGTPVSFVQPGLKPSWLARVMLGVRP